MNYEASRHQQLVIRFFCQHRLGRLVDIVGDQSAVGDDVGRICTYVRRLETVGLVALRNTTGARVYVWCGPERLSPRRRHGFT